MAAAEAERRALSDRRLELERVASAQKLQLAGYMIQQQQQQIQQQQARMANPHLFGLSTPGQALAAAQRLDAQQKAEVDFAKFCVTQGLEKGNETLVKSGMGLFQSSRATGNMSADLAAAALAPPAASAPAPPMPDFLALGSDPSRLRLLAPAPP